MTCWPEGGPGLEPGTDMFGIAGTVELGTICPGTGTWNRLQDGTRIPPHVRSLLTNHSRPDVFLFIPPKLPNRPTPEYIILELKYCRDTDPQNQYDRAISQHRPLADAIQQAAPHARITYIPLLLGVAGTIYSSTTSHLRYLGVRKQALPRLLNRLHVMAITNLHWIYTTKRHKERHLDPQFWRHTHPPR